MVKFNLRKYQQKYRQDHKEKLKEYSRERYKNKKNEINAKSKKYQQTHREQIAIERKGYRQDPEHKKIAIAYAKKYAQENKEKLAAQKKIYNEKNKVKIAEVKKEYGQKNRGKINISRNEKNKVNINFRLAGNLRNRLRLALKRGSKAGSAVRDLGFTISELKVYLENQFQPGMTWENWTRDGWHIDHIIPLDFFDLTDKEQFLKAVHYTNLQPMWGIENNKKSNKIAFPLDKPPTTPTMK